jgi:hypothetical protein
MSITKSNSVLETVSCLKKNAAMSSIHFCKKTFSHLLITERKSEDFLSAVCYNETFLLLVVMHYCEKAVE